MHGYSRTPLVPDATFSRIDEKKVPRWHESWRLARCLGGAVVLPDASPVPTALQIMRRVCFPPPRMVKLNDSTLKLSQRAYTRWRRALHATQDHSRGGLIAWALLWQVDKNFHEPTETTLVPDTTFPCTSEKRVPRWHES